MSMSLPTTLIVTEPSSDTTNESALAIGRSSIDVTVPVTAATAVCAPSVMV